MIFDMLLQSNHSALGECSAWGKMVGTSHVNHKVPSISCKICSEIFCICLTRDICPESKCPSKLI